MGHRLGTLRSYVRGWMGYFGLASQSKLFDKLDQWIRRRIRMCFWKRWRHVRTRRRELIKLGVPRRQAIRHAKSRQGPWHMAKTIASGVGMTTAGLALPGVVSLKSLWVELAPLRRTAGCGSACQVVWGGRPAKVVLTRFRHPSGHRSVTYRTSTPSVANEAKAINPALARISGIETIKAGPKAMLV